MSKRYRWAVSFTDKYAVDDWGCGNCREYFETEKLALECVEKNKRKGKPFYWQPYMWKEVEVEITTKHWNVCKKS